MGLKIILLSIFLVSCKNGPETYSGASENSQMQLNLSNVEFETFSNSAKVNALMSQTKALNGRLDLLESMSGVSTSTQNNSDFSLILTQETNDVNNLKMQNAELVNKNNSLNLVVNSLSLRLEVLEKQILALNPIKMLKLASISNECAASREVLMIQGNNVFQVAENLSKVSELYLLEDGIHISNDGLCTFSVNNGKVK